IPGFIKRNTTLFTSAICLRTLYFSLVRSILEYGSFVWFPYLACDQLRLDSTLNIPTLASRRKHADLMFITSLLNGAIDAPDLLATVSFRVPSYSTRHHSFFSIPTYLTSYGHNQPLHRMLHLLNQP
ncbi:Uncharacterized protein FWK35_00023395, partial [Aphis craccivora]